MTDVPKRTQEELVGEQLDSLMREAGAKSFQNVYFSKDQLAQMPPDERAKALQFMALNAMMAKKERERTKAAKFATPTP